MKRCMAVFAALSVAWLCMASAGAGTFSVSPWTSDADSGINASKVYTHSAKFRTTDGDPFYAGNGVWFEGDGNRQGASWRIFNVPNDFDGSGSNVAGDGANLLVNFIFGDPGGPSGAIHPQLALYDLVPGTRYVTTFYAKGWEASGRVINVSADDPDNPGIYQIDQDLYGGGNGLLLKYDYVAPASGQIIFTFAETVTNTSWHHYAFSNEVYMPVYVDRSPYEGEFTDLNVTLRFTAIASEGVELVSPTYDLYWGTDPNELTPVLGLTEGTYALGSLPEATEYHWQVDVFDEGERVFSTDPNNVKRTWMFTTTTLAPATKVLEYKMDEDQLTVVPESVAGYDGVAVDFDDPNGTSWTEGLAGNCLDFDGIDSYVDLGDEAPLPFGAGQAFSISGYVKTTDMMGPIIAFRNSEDGDPIVAVTVGFDGASVVPGRLRYISRADGVLRRITGPRVVDGEWNHFALVRAETGVVSLYLNGQLAGTVNDGLAAYDMDLRSIGAELAWIAGEGPGAPDTWFLDGLIDEVVIWDGALKQDQIDAMVAAIPYRINPLPAADAGAGVVLHWEAPFGTAEGATYSVYVGTDSELTVVTDGATGLTDTEFALTEPLEAGTDYYWQVEVVNGDQTIYVSPVWPLSMVGSFSGHAWTSDADSDISADKVYTHKVNFGPGGTDGAMVNAGNGVSFENDTNRSGANWSLANVPNNFTGHTPPITGDSLALAQAFYFGENAGFCPVLTLTGLTPGTRYVTTFYTTAFGGAGARFCNIIAGDNPYNTTRIDENAPVDRNGWLIKYTYTAPSSEMTFTFAAENPANSWHHYAFSNEEALPFELALVSPAPRAHVDAGDVELRWRDVPAHAAAQATFNVIVATDAELTSRVVDLTNQVVPDMRYTVEGLDADTQYFWRIEGLLGAQVVTRSPVGTFFTRSTEPAAILVEWSMDDGTGQVVTETYAGLDGTLMNFDDPNTAWVPGISNTGLELDGFDDYVDLGDISGLSAPAGFAFSMSGYFKTTDPEGPIFAMRPPGILCVYVGFDGADSVPGHFRFISAANGLRRITGPRVDDGRWHHFAVTRSRFGAIELYIDGAFAGATDDFGAAYPTSEGAFGTDKVWLTDWSQSHPAEQLHLDGTIDQITIWQGVLLPSQIEALSAILPSRADLDEDGDVDIDDLLILAAGWLTDAVPADIDASGRADIDDLAVLSQDWGK